MNLMLSDFFGKRLRDAVVDRTKVEEADEMTRIKVHVRDFQIGVFRTQYKWIPRNTVFVAMEQAA